MFKKWLKSILLLCLMAPVSLKVNAQNLKQNFLERMNASVSTVTSIKSDFVQTRTISIMEEALISSGQFYYKKPGLIKWDQQLPTPYYFILNGAKVIRYDGTNRKEMSANNPQVSHFKEFILGTVTGSLFKTNQFSSLFERNGDEVKIILIPQQKIMKKKIATIEMIFGYDKMILLNLTIREAGGDKLMVDFSNHQFNTLTNNAIFN